ncbi:MAG: hypothetical protein U1E10_18750 [Bdellovibrionales bacterium]|nr:hypothetical protein [Bdellovibrionales bacterium]
MSNKSELVMERKGTSAEPLLVLTGAFTGDAWLPFAGFAGIKKLVIDLANVTRMNSTGVRQWHIWMTGLRAESPEALVVLRNCPRFFIETMNMIYEFVPGPHAIESFVVPMYCEECDESQDTLLDYSQSGSDDLTSSPEIVVPEVICESCNKPMELDCVEKTYFKFLNKSNESLAKVKRGV